MSDNQERLPKQNFDISRDYLLKEVRSIRVGPSQQLRQVQIPEKLYDDAKRFVVWAPNLDERGHPFRFKVLYNKLPYDDSIYLILSRDAGDTPLDKAKEKIKDWQEAVKSLLRYALNLLLAPKRPEFLRLKLSSSYFVYQVSKKLKEADKILVCMGYKKEPGSQELKYEGEVRVDQVAETATDLVILHGELDRIIGIVSAAITDNYRNVQLQDILAARALPMEVLSDALQSSARMALQRLQGNPFLLLRYPQLYQQLPVVASQQQQNTQSGYRRQPVVASSQQQQQTQVSYQHQSHAQEVPQQRYQPHMQGFEANQQYQHYAQHPSQQPYQCPQQQHQHQPVPYPHSDIGNVHEREQVALSDRRGSAPAVRYHGTVPGQWHDQQPNINCSQISSQHPPSRGASAAVSNPPPQQQHNSYANIQVLIDPAIQQNYGSNGQLVNKDSAGHGDEDYVNFSKPSPLYDNIPGQGIPPQRDPATSIPPNPSNLPEPIFREQKDLIMNQAMTYDQYPGETNMSLMLNTRSTHDFGSSGPNLDSMLSEGDPECLDHYQNLPQGRALQHENPNASSSREQSWEPVGLSSENQGVKMSDKSTNLSKVPPTKDSDDESQETVHQLCQEMNLDTRKQGNSSSSNIMTEKPSCETSRKEGASFPLSKGDHDYENQKTIDDEFSKNSSSNQNSSGARRKPVPLPRKKSLDTELDPQTEPIDGNRLIDTKVEDDFVVVDIMAEQKGDTETMNHPIVDCEEESSTKPHSSPHPSLENNSAKPSVESDHSLPESGPNSLSDTATLQALGGPLDSINFPVARERSNAIIGTGKQSPTSGKTQANVSKTEPLITPSNRGTVNTFPQSATTLSPGVSLAPYSVSDTWACEYCTNLNPKHMHNCEICGRERVSTV